MSAILWDELVEAIGEAGQQMVQLGAAEGAAGNISVFVGPHFTPDPRWRQQRELRLPTAVPALAHGWVVVTGAGRRLRDIARRPQTTLCLLKIHPGGTQATLLAADNIRPTSELNSHLAVHNDQVERRELATHAVVHAQPLRLTYLSHLARYGDAATLARMLLRWQPETIIEFPEGIGTIPFQTPSSAEQMHATATALQTYRAVIWQKHGIVARAEQVSKAADLIEYAEAAAQYEYLNLAAGAPSSGLTQDELRAICAQFGVTQTLF